MGLWSPVTRRCFRWIFIFWRVSCINSDSGECAYDAKFAFIESMCHFCEIWCTHTGRTVQMAAWQKKTNEIQQVWLTLRIADLDPPFPSRSGVAISRDLIRHNFPWFHQRLQWNALNSKCRGFMLQNVGRFRQKSRCVVFVHQTNFCVISRLRSWNAWTAGLAVS